MTTPFPSAPRVVVVMPVYDEERTVCDVLDAVRAHHDGPIVVVDDGSADRTGECLASRDDVEVVRHETNRGYGRSLIDGFARAMELGADAIVTMDCDGQHEPAHIPAFVEALADADIVSGSRYLPGSAECGMAPPARAEVNRRVTEVVDAATGWRLTDSFCGFKAYRADALARLTLTEDGYALPLQLWAEARRAGLRVNELAVERIYHDHDRTFGQDLDDPDQRFAYYMRVWGDAMADGEAR